MKPFSYRITQGEQKLLLHSCHIAVFCSRVLIMIWKPPGNEKREELGTSVVVGNRGWEDKAIL